MKSFQDKTPSVADQEDPLVTELAGELIARWESNDRVPVEQLLDRHPKLWHRPQQAVPLVFEELCLRRELGLADDTDDVFRRFPQWREQLELMVEYHRLLEAPPARPRFPRVGDTLAGFHLLEVLGTGSGGRVFLARQCALADRPVVLKITPLEGREYLNLARLQHTHIVPLYAVHDDPAQNLRILCMPFVGGLSLDRLLRELGKLDAAERNGDRMLALLEAQGAQSSSPAPALLQGLTFVQAICWIGACLADALEYAHEGGLIHLDLKPSNVLLAADGQPMLLDFHLSRPAVRAGQQVLEGIGGTPGYMPPEQEEALAAVARGNPVPRNVDQRADIFGLAAVLYEALGGQLPFLPNRTPPLQRRNRLVSVGLSDVLEKCLAPCAQDRYGSAGSLAADLRAHLSDLPLKGVRNRSWRERFGKWRRRRPSGLRTWSLAVLLVGGLAVTFTAALTRWQHRLQDAQTSLREARKDWQERQCFPEAIGRLQHGLDLARAVPLGQKLVAELQQELEHARDAQAASQRLQTLRDLHELADSVRSLYGLDFSPPAHLEAQVQAFWMQRHQIRDWFTGTARLAEVAVDEAANDLADLALFAADWRIRSATSADRPAALKEALAALDEAAALFGPNAVLHHARQRNRKELHLPPLDDATAPEPGTVWELTTLGRLHLRAGELVTASAYLHEATERWPHGFWPNYYLGVCCHQQGSFTEAANAFSVCIGASPTTAAAYHNRALAHSALGLPRLAIRDYSRALELDPKLSAAALNRGLLHYETRQYAQAELDLERALTLGARPVVVHFNLALVQLASKKPDRARHHLNRVLSLEPDHAAAKKLWQDLQ